MERRFLPAVYDRGKKHYGGEAKIRDGFIFRTSLSAQRGAWGPRKRGTVSM